MWEESLLHILVSNRVLGDLQGGEFSWKAVWAFSWAGQFCRYQALSCAQAAQCCHWQLTLGWKRGSKLPRDWTGTVVNTSDKLELQLNMINYMWRICLKTYCINKRSVRPWSSHSHHYFSFSIFSPGIKSQDWNTENLWTFPLLMKYLDITRKPCANNKPIFFQLWTTHGTELCSAPGLQLKTPAI